MSSTVSYLLTGDIGGTNSRMGLYHVGNDTPLGVVYYRNNEHLTKREDGIFQKKIIYPFLKHIWDTVPNMPPIELAEIIACFAIAGPVKDNKVIMSNLHGIEICGDSIVDGTYDCGEEGNFFLKSICDCKIINDFVAQGYGCLTLQPDEVIELTPGALNKIDPTGPKACIGAGTGLGECFLTPDERGNYSCFPSEGGHVDWAPRTDVEIKLLQFLKERFAGKNRVSVERVVSGTGLGNCYDFFAREYPKKINKAVHKEILESGDMKGRAVAMGVEKCELCRSAMETMITAYGSECGNVGIKLIPTGGLYVTGGLTPKNIKWIEGKDSLFIKSFYDKGRVSPLLDNVPLIAVMVEDMGVRGARKSAEIQHEMFEARKAALLNRNPIHPPSSLKLDSMAAGSNDPVTARLLKLEKDVEETKTLAKMSMALTIGVVAGFALMKNR